MKATHDNDSTETWLPIPGYEGLYDVSDQGRVRSWRTWRGQPGPRILTHCPDNHGYPRVPLSRAGERKVWRVHILVAIAFLGPRPEGQEVRHLDGDPTNPELWNLVYGTPSENNLDKVRHGTHHEARKTHCLNGHPFDDENTYRQSSGARGCRTCRREYFREYMRRRRAQRKHP